MVGEALSLNCTAMVEFNAGVDIQWSYPGKEVNSSSNGYSRERDQQKTLRFRPFFPFARQAGWRLSLSAKL